MKKIPWKKVLYIGFCMILIIVIFCAGVVLYMNSSVSSLVYNNADLRNAPSRQAAIVFGASVNPGNMMPSDILADRIITGIELYKVGKVKKLVMSGDNRVTHYNEPQVMAKFAEEKGVPSADIVLDYAGRRTYDTCYRAKEIFGINNAILVTQKYHLYRALYTCRGLGLDVVGVDSARQTYIGQFYYNFREIFAELSAFFDVHVLHPTPVLGEKIDIGI